LKVGGGEKENIFAQERFVRARYQFCGRKSRIRFRRQQGTERGGVNGKTEQDDRKDENVRKAPEERGGTILSLEGHEQEAPQRGGSLQPSRKKINRIKSTEKRKKKNI